MTPTTSLRPPVADADLESEVLGRDTRVRVADTTAAPFRYICQLDYAPPGGGGWTGSGTLIGPRTVLTAAHNLRGATPAHMRVTPGLAGTTRPFGSAQSAEFRYWFAGFGAADEATARDLALIRLATPLTRGGVWTRSASRSRVDPVGRSIAGGPLPVRAGTLTVNLSGYPGDKCGTARRPLACGTTQWRTYNATVRVHSGLLHYLNDTKPGHSGSPVWVRRHPSMGGRVLVAVHVARHDDRRGRAVSNTSVLLTPAMVRWIATNTA